MIRVDSVSYRIGKKTLVDGVSFEISPGTFTAIIGPNGAGKSTMLGLLSGDHQPSDGTVFLRDRAAGRWRPLELARERAVMLQQQTTHFSFSVHEAVEMGRLPHDVDRERDRRVVDEALEDSGLTPLRKRDVTTLSGGEGARVGYARATAQETPILLLDEPTAALDLHHQEKLLRSAKKRAEDGAAVVVVLHDLNHASRYADRILMFDGGRLVADGPPGHVLTPERIDDVYHQPVCRLTHPQTGDPVLIPMHD
ncbi:heme ABC transporter ATP-binding protein [Curtobacterium sp. S6]|uniref:heme ABC transporter ATP-binding protein n=1 Tax=Curtobacterium sp. S6 TaxID=1479623 RepID=UPI0004AA49C9|nr:heme ABC transporter ATP-binding protein [Curtobacterium sp. S6]